VSGRIFARNGFLGPGRDVVRWGMTYPGGTFNADKHGPALGLVV